MFKKRRLQFSLSALIFFVLGVIFYVWFRTDGHEKIMGNIHYYWYVRQFSSDKIQVTKEFEPLAIDFDHNQFLVYPDEYRTFEFVLADPNATVHYEYYEHKFQDTDLEVVAEGSLPMSHNRKFRAYTRDTLWEGDLPYNFPHPHGDVPLFIKENTQEEEIVLPLGTLHVLGVSKESMMYSFTPVETE